MEAQLQRTLSAIYAVVRKAYTKRVEVDREFQRKTNTLVQEHIGTYEVHAPLEFVEINERTIELIKKKHAGDGTKGGLKYLERMARMAIVRPDKARRREDTGTKYPTEEQRRMGEREPCAQRVSAKR